MREAKITVRPWMRLAVESAGYDDYDDYDEHSAENEPEWPAPPVSVYHDMEYLPEYQPDEEPPADWPGFEPTTEWEDGLSGS